MDRLRAKDIFLAAVNQLPNPVSVTLALAMSMHEDIYKSQNRCRFCEPLQELYRQRAPAQFRFLLPHLQNASVPLQCLRLETVQHMNVGTMASFQ